APARLGALEVPIRAGSIALAPDGGLFAAEGNHVWRVSPDGFLTEVAGPWNPGQVLINSITVDKGGNLYVAEAYQHVIWRIDPQGRAAAIAGQGTQLPAGPGPYPANSVAAGAIFMVIDSRNNLCYRAGSRIWRSTPDGLLSAMAAT